MIPSKDPLDYQEEFDQYLYDRGINAEYWDDVRYLEALEQYLYERYEEWK